MRKNVSKIILAMLIFLIPVALGININYGTNGASSYESYSLDPLTSLQIDSIFGDGTFSQKTQISGMGDNAFGQQTSGNGYEAESTIATIDSSQFSVSTSTMATSEGTSKVMNMVGSGDIAAYASSSTDLTSTGQEALVFNGDMTTTQKVATGNGISISSQNTELLGDACAIGSKSVSPENTMVIAGGISNSGDTNAELVSVAADHAGIYGTNSFNGQEVVDDNVLQAVADGKLSVSVDGIYENRNGDLGNYRVTVSNTVKPSVNNVAFGIGWKWNAPIHYKLSTNLIGSSTSANAKLWAQEISKGANEWDSKTAKNVFKGSDTTNTAGSNNVIEFTSKVPVLGVYQGGTGDGNNNYMEVTKSITGSTIAVTWTWFYTDTFITGWDGDPYCKAVESDVYFNGNKYWRIATAESTVTNSKFDVRTIATHEVGHSLGLLDLYGSKDTNKIMYGYNNGQVKWYLRNADKLGLWSLYGP